jgi:hypothetical protein
MLEAHFASGMYRKYNAIATLEGRETQKVMVVVVLGDMYVYIGGDVVLVGQGLSGSQGKTGKG